MGFVVVAAAVAVVLMFIALTYNGLVSLRNRYKNSYAQIDVQLKRRYDLLPNLVETAKAFMAHERGTLEAVIAARNQAAGAASKMAADPTNTGAMQALSQAEGALSGAVGKFFALAEAYPTLKSDQTMTRLMEELSSTENKISFSRQAFNDAIMHYNTAREKFPAALFAGALGFQSAALFEVTNPVERETVKVSFK